MSLRRRFNVPEALAARAGRDFVTSGGSAWSAGGKRAAAALAALVRFMIRRPAVVLGCAILVAALAAVALNALAWQSARHPSPLFPRKAEPERRLAAAPTPLPPARPPEVRAPAAVTTPAAPPPAATPNPPAPPPKPAASRDPIGDLIRGGETGSAAAKDASSKVMAAQRALTKLGYGQLKSDGVIGPGTRQAIERFEKERNLAVTGELNPRTSRELAAQAGMPIE
jgi:type IV secretory pathway VirB10-like protein